MSLRGVYKAVVTLVLIPGINYPYPQAQAVSPVSRYAREVWVYLLFYKNISSLSILISSRAQWKRHCWHIMKADQNVMLTFII